jgi:phenylpropionate dioxygenase-like ring-hydroxylating dioxygenase large terminal subunit
LSEGRVEDDGSLMCSYHAWRFNGNGEVEVVPQALTTELDRIKRNSKSSCNSFPTKVKNGLLWVWPSSGSDARILSELTPIVDMSLEGFFDDVDESRAVVGPWNFRFIPHGFDYFIENVIDPAQ